MNPSYPFPLPSSCHNYMLTAVGAVNAAARGQGAAFAQGSTDEGTQKQKVREVGQVQSQAQTQRQVQGKQVDHLGIEG